LPPVVSYDDARRRRASRKNGRPASEDEPSTGLVASC
jgi:hypothetical protein